MKFFTTTRAMISGLSAILLVIFGLWLWSRAEMLASSIAASSPTLVQAVQAIAIGAIAAAQALLLREVVPVFYARRWMDEVLHLLAGLVMVGGLAAGLVLLVQSS